MPGLTLNNSSASSCDTDAGNNSAYRVLSQTQNQTNRNGNSSSSALGAQPQTPRPSSPIPPPVSPITPVLETRQLPTKPTSTSHIPLPSLPPPAIAVAVAAAASSSNVAPSFAQNRPTFTHQSHPAHVPSIPAPTAPPAPPPIDFGTNPDVLALKSAISILQIQRAKAEADILSLKRAKEEALVQPAEFLRDISTGQIRTVGDGLLFPQSAAAGQDDVDNGDDSSSSDDEDDNMEGQQPNGQNGSTEPAANGGLEPSPMKAQAPKKKGKANVSAPKPAWSTLPKPQVVVRCPPVNWSKYGVVGESLDKLHEEQRTQPTLGTPATVNTDGTYEFKGEPNPADGKSMVGIAAPYTPGQDKLDKKAKSARRG